MPLHEIDKKLEYFTKVMLEEAISQSQKITSKLSQEENDLISKSKEEIEQKINHEKEKQIAKINEKEEARVNARVTENKRELLEYRENCAQEVFEKAKLKIEEFTNSESYCEHLGKLLQKGLKALNTDSLIEVRLRPQDMKFIDELKKLDTKSQMNFAQGNISLGGLCLVCHEKAMRIDLAFEAALRDMVGHLSELTGLGR